jgi:hypothetical protein
VVAAFLENCGERTSLLEFLLLYSIEFPSRIQSDSFHIYILISCLLNSLNSRMKSRLIHHSLYNISILPNHSKRREGISKQI